MHDPKAMEVSVGVRQALDAAQQYREYLNDEAFQLEIEAEIKRFEAEIKQFEAEIKRKISTHIGHEEVEDLPSKLDLDEIKG